MSSMVPLQADVCLICLTPLLLAAHSHSHTVSQTGGPLRSVARRYRHLMNDIIALIPHSKKDSKLDTKNDRQVINEVADMKVCGVFA